MRFTLPVLPAMLLYLASAGMLTAQDPAKRAPPELFPLTLGTEWEYQAGAFQLVERVDGFDDIQGERCARIITLINGKEFAAEHVAVRADGVYRVAIAGEAVVPPLCFLKLPARNGEIWKVKSRVQNQEIAGKFTTSQELIQTPTGQRLAICARGTDFEAQGKPLAFTYYFVPGVGKVRQSITSGDQETTLELKEFRPAGAAANPATPR